MVGDDERLYRRIRFSWTVLRDGVWRLTSEAFNDVHWKPSVDRQTICQTPDKTQVVPTDGVAQLVAQEVRAIGGIVHNPAAKPPVAQITYKLDVLARPIAKNNPEGLPENLAHAQIEADPGVANRSRFDKLKDALGRIAERHGWAIEPTAQPPEPMPRAANDD